MHIGFCQFKPEFGQIEKNLNRAYAFIEDADFDLLVLPELFTTGYQFGDQNETRSLAETKDGQTVNWAIDLAKKKNAFLCGGFAEIENDKVYNSSFLAGPKGLVDVYRKIHLFNREKECFAPGDGRFEVYDIGLAKVGIMICFDWIFPESMRVLALKGAQIVLHPANLVLPYCQQSMKTRCLENGLFAITANRNGTESRLENETFTFSGQSQITAPLGKVLSSVAEDFQGVQIVQIDPQKADDKNVNPYNNLFADRRPGKYEVLTKGNK